MLEGAGAGTDRTVNPVLLCRAGIMEGNPDVRQSLLRIPTLS